MAQQVIICANNDPDKDAKVAAFKNNNHCLVLPKDNGTNMVAWVNSVSGEPADREQV